MQTRGSLKHLKKRDKNCKIVYRKKRTRNGEIKKVMYIINKLKPRFKAKQGSS